jgi:hypothetical protein
MGLYCAQARYAVMLSRVPQAHVQASRVHARPVDVNTYCWLTSNKGDNNMIENMKEYNVREILSNIGFLLLSIFGGILAGLVFGIIGSFIYLILVFPAIMGGIGGYIITESAKYTKTRNSRYVIFSSLLTALILYIAFHYMRYLGLHAITALQTFGDFSDKSLAAAKVVVEYALEKETGHSGFIGYILFKAKQGVSIGRIFSSNKLNLGPIFTWFYWLIEIGIIAFITVSVGKQIAKKPFCEFCNSWYAEQRHIGGISANKEIEILNLIKQRDFAGMGKNLEENSDSPSLELYLQGCKSCDKSNSFLTISKAKYQNGKLVFSELLRTTLKPEEKKLLVDEIKFLEK